MKVTKPYCYEYPRPALTADCIALSEKENETFVLLIKRAHEPFKDDWAFPGGFVDMAETVYEAAKRELEEETGIVTNELKQMHTFSAIDRDPRGRTVSVVYYVFINSDIEIKAGDDASHAAWFSLKNLPKLAFDHDQIISFAKDFLKLKL